MVHEQSLFLYGQLKLLDWEMRCLRNKLKQHSIGHDEQIHVYIIAVQINNLR